ncbi:hypothetical protein [Bradyrhizobium prioriisuperbiae]|uniref:hypothetical protein n=1 Tax=Bradyrhizobium prioriisuperbiae TaxID=2854389 RepID=UPI0028E4E645|nr:hypothetical protein [Bradyrhizobium prioritasuperba]
MSDYTILRSEVGWVVCVAGEPVLLVDDEELARQIVREAVVPPANGRQLASGAVPNVTVKSPSMQSDAGDNPAPGKTRAPQE